MLPLQLGSPPTITVCNPDKKPLYILRYFSDTELELCHGNMSKFSLSVPSEVDGSHYDAYDSIQTKRLLCIQAIGYFIITEVNENKGEEIPVKSVTAFSLEAELNFKRLNLFSGTYKFYDPISPKGTLLHEILSGVPDWSVGEVDITLGNKYRTFDVSDSKIYKFLTDDAASSYDCVFLFDTFAKTVSAYPKSKVASESDVVLSFRNLIQEISIEEQSEEIITVLNVYGGNDLDIHSVNPLGTNSIYDFSFYTTPEWMEQDLIDAINAWKRKVDAAQDGYSSLLTQKKNANLELIKLNGQLKDLEAERDALEGVLSARIKQGLPTGTYASQIAQKEREIAAKKSEINNKQSQISGLNTQLSSISASLQFVNNFTQDQLERLSAFMYEDTYQDSNFITTDQFTAADVQEMSESLYEKGKAVLAEAAQPVYQFDLSAVNFLYLDEYRDFANSLELGNRITVEIEKNRFIKPILLEINFSFDDPDKFSLTFGNTYHLKNNAFELIAEFDDAMRSGTDAKFNSAKWSDWVSSGSKENITNFVNSALDLSKNKVISASGQDMTLTEYGFRGRKLLENGSYSPTQFWMVNDTIAFTRDNWQTSSLALGEITLGKQKYFGIVAEALVGNLVASSQLQIRNENNSFVVDSNGASLTNASFTLTTQNGKNQILLDPSNGFRIQKRTSITSAWVDQLYLDNSGNIITVGGVNAKEGNIGGWNIKANGLFSPYGDYFRNDGYGKLGNMKWTPSSTTFTGDIFTDNGRLGNWYINGNGLYGNGTIFVQDGSIDFWNGSIWQGERGALIIQSKYSGVVINASGYDVLNVYNDQVTEVVGQFDVYGNYGRSLTVQKNGSVGIGGNLSVSGSKNCVQRTVSYGNRLINAYETAEYYFGDIGNSSIEHGECRIEIDPVFRQCVNTDIGYQVMITPYGAGVIYVAERHPEYFVVKGDDISFVWEIKAKRRGYENIRLELCNIVDDTESEVKSDGK